MDMQQSSSWPEQDVHHPPQRNLLEWWYRLAAPQEPVNATPFDRERVRAGRLSSIILFIMFCFGLSQLPSALISTNHFFIFFLITAMAIDVGAFVLNRQGQVQAAGIIMVIVVEVTFMLVVLTTPNGLTSRSLTTFHLIVLTELMAVSLLPPRSVFVMMFCNLLFTWAAITFMRHTPDLNLATSSLYYSALASPFALQIIAAIVTYLWAQSARDAIARAEQVAALEHTLAERDRVAAEQKVQLEQGIQQILQTQIQAANGNFAARAPLARENVLWQVAYALNNLLARLQSATQSENDLQRANMEVGRLAQLVRTVKGRRARLDLKRSGTILDPLAQELHGTYIDLS